MLGEKQKTKQSEFPLMKVEVKETYKNSCHATVRVLMSGYGAGHKGFVVLDIEELEHKLGEHWSQLLPFQTFRPEYALALKERLEQRIIQTTEELYK